MKTILFVCDERQRFKAQCDMAKSLEGEFRMIFLIADDIEFSCLDDKKVFVFKRDRLRLAILKPFSLGQLILFFLEYFALMKNESFVDEVFNKEEVDIVILNGDRSSTPIVHAIIKIAKLNSIPLVMPSLSYISDGLKIRENKFLFSLSFFSSLFCQIVYRCFFDSHVVINSGKPCYFYHPYQILAYRLFGTLSLNPWMVGNGGLDYILLDNNEAKNVVLKGLYSEAKLIVCGDIQLDTLFYFKQRKLEIRFGLFKQLQLNLKKKVVVIALPQFAEHGLLGWEQHLHLQRETFNQLTEFNVLVSLHPKMDSANYHWISETYQNCFVVDNDLVSLLPLADCFVNAFSSTTIWAIYCGIPTVIIDLINFNYDIFDMYESVSIVKDVDMLESEIFGQMDRNIDYLTDWALLDKESLFDGNCQDRICKVMREISRSSFC